MPDDGAGGDVGAAVAAAFRSEWAKVVATLIRTTGDWDLAEECASDAFAVALERWPDDGIPARPGAWLVTVARHRALDKLRRARVGRSKLAEAAVLASAGEEPDDVLALMYTCCHPALSLGAQVALTLRTVAGLDTAQIARAFMVSEPTMAQRLVRAKHKIRHAGIPFRVPLEHHYVERTTAVLAVVYLLFNEGYSATSGSDLVRAALCEEAIRIGRLLAALMPDEPEALGLLALMLLQHARNAARVDATGDLVLLSDQDRQAWDAAAIAEGCALVESALRLRRPGTYQVQAAIAACHGRAVRAEDTDWHEIAGLYAELERIAPSPVVSLNRAVAVGMAAGPEAGLELLGGLTGLDEYHLLPAASAEFLRRLGRSEEAAAAYRAALDLVRTDAERRFLVRRLREVAGERSA